MASRVAVGKARFGALSKAGRLTLTNDTHYYAHSTGQHLETNTRRIVARLLREGWLNLGGGNHDKFSHPDRPGVLIIVPRHRDLSTGVARDIAKKAGWPL